jgi:hypothetical protein
VRLSNKPPTRGKNIGHTNKLCFSHHILTSSIVAFLHFLVLKFKIVCHILFTQRPSENEGSTHPAQSTTRPPPSLYFPDRQGGDRMSPGSLDQRLMAELNRLEFMEESVRQLTDIERTKSVSFAQQETVSLAQILKVMRFPRYHASSAFNVFSLTEFR